MGHAVGPSFYHIHTDHNWIWGYHSEVLISDPIIFVRQGQFSIDPLNIPARCGVKRLPLRMPWLESQSSCGTLSSWVDSLGSLPSKLLRQQLTVYGE